MNCDDVRRGLLAFLGGPIGLTDWALLEAHMKHCAECREAEAHLRRVAMATQPITRPRAMLALLPKANELARLGVTCSARLMRHGALLTPADRDLTSRTATHVMRAIGAVGHVAHLLARIHVSLATVRELAGRTIAGGLQTVRLTITRSVNRTIHFRPSVQVVGIVLALAFTLSAPPRTDEPEQLAEPPRPEPGPTRVEPERAEPVRLEPPLSAPPVEQRTTSAAPPRTDERRRFPSAAPPRAVPLSPPDVSASELAIEAASSPPMLLSELPASATHVVGQLSAKNPRTVQRDFTALLADVGGTELGRSHRVRFTTVEVLVPQSRYNEFADGLARIGSWRLEAARVPLPDAVHMSIRVNE